MDTVEYILSKYNLENADNVEIPEGDRVSLAKILHELDFKTGVEVGVQHGIYSEILCKENPQMKVYGVDPWESIESAIANPPDRKTENHSTQSKLDKFYRGAMRRLAPYSNYEIIKEYSVDGVNRFKDESLDFVYIDANHSDQFVKDDIWRWSKKIRKGGIVSGHDYYNTGNSGPRVIHIRKIVDEYVKLHGIKPLIIWGGENPPSWSWIK